jgi:hypothetical protein
MSEEKSKIPRSSTGLYITIVLVVVVVSCAACVIALPLGLMNTIQSWLRGFNPPTSATIDLSDTITTTLSAQTQILTAETNPRGLQVRVNITKWVANAGGYGATYETDATIKVGYDFRRTDFNVESTGEKSFRINLPRAELLSCSMQPVQEIDRSTSLTADWDSAKALGEYMLMRGFVREALDDTDLFEVAQSNARQMIGDLLRSVAPDISLEYNFKQDGQTRIDDTCNLRQPIEWEYNEAENNWQRQ